MPCYDGRDMCNERVDNREVEIVNYLKDIKMFNTEKSLSEIKKQNDLNVDTMGYLIERNNLLARNLCYVMKALNKEDANKLCEINKELKTWYEEHLLFDEKRK